MNSSGGTIIAGNNAVVDTATMMMKYAENCTYTETPTAASSSVDRRSDVIVLLSSWRVVTYGS